MQAAAPSLACILGVRRRLRPCQEAATETDGVSTQIVDRKHDAATEPVAGTIPPSPGPIASGLVAIKRAPAVTKRMARVMRSKLYAVVSPNTTYSGS